MEDIGLDRSPDRDTHVRLSGRVRAGASGPDTYWFEVPARLADQVTTGPEPWLVLLLPLAVASGGDLVLPGRADATLVRNARELVRIWACWFPWASRVEIRVEESETRGPVEAGRTVLFFSGGVDSFFSLLRHEEDGGDGKDGGEVDDLLTVCGFDVPVDEDRACRRLFASATDVASALGKELVTVLTNVRETGWEDRVPWELLGYGPALVACAHVLRGRFGRALVPAGSGYARMSPRGSHPLTDPLLGSDVLEVSHEGAHARRVEKTRRVAKSGLARRHLRVCWRSVAADNCSECEKCYRTMATLHLLGVLPQFDGFDRSRFRVSRVPRVLMKKESDLVFWGEVEELAKGLGREQEARAIRSAFRRSRIKHRLLGLSDRLDGLPGLWRTGRWLRRRVTARSIV